MAMASEAGPASAELGPGLSEPAAVLAPAVGRRDLPYRVVSSRVPLLTRFLRIWQSRELLVFLIRKELKVKYKSSVLGLLWSMVNPAIVLLVYYIVFKYIAKNNTPYFALYLFAGLLVWNLFATALPGASSTIVANAGIVKKVAFAREVLPLSQVGTATVFLFFQVIVMALFLAGFQLNPAWSYLPLVLFALVDLVLLTAALAIFVSAVNVYFRDVEHLVAVLLQAWFWFVAIVYNYDTVYAKFVAHHLRWLAAVYLADPIQPIVLAFQRFFYGRVFVTVPIPNYPHYTVQVLAGYSYHFYLEMLAGLLVASLAALFGALVVFGRVEGNFAEEL